MSNKTYVNIDKKECPFKERDLKNDCCYNGIKEDRCKYFVRYDWDKHYNHIECTHPPIKDSQQLELFNF